MNVKQNVNDKDGVKHEIQSVVDTRVKFSFVLVG